MRLLRRTVKIVLLLLWSSMLALPAALSLLTVRSWARVRRGTFWAQLWSRGAARIAGVKIITHGQWRNTDGKLLVSNHLGYLDIVTHGSLFPIRFTPKAEIKKWFLIGNFVALGSPVWIDRQAKSKSAYYAGIFRETMLNGVSLLVYPEGTSSDGKHGLRPFKSTVFAALPDNGKILPMVLFYHETPADSVPAAWFGDISFPAHVWGVLGLEEIRIDVFIMPEMEKLPGENRKELANRVREAMQKEYDRHEKDL